MKIYRMDQSEHIKTRSLWEEVFSEDTKAFLDYYYYIKAKDNEIYVIETEDGISSMLHVNPYEVKIEKRTFPSSYIVAVSTKKEYRSRGFMRELLCRSMEDMYDQKMPFTFLMPASEKIYWPYDFRFIYEQNVSDLSEDQLKELSLICPLTKECEYSDAGLWDAEELSVFFETYAKDRWQVRAIHDISYYQTMILEQQSEKGGIRLIRENGVLKGFYAYACEDGVEVREPVYLEEYEGNFIKSLLELKNKKIKVLSAKDSFAHSKRNIIMARIIHLKTFLEALQVDKEEQLNCSFAVIDPILQKNSCVWKLTSNVGGTDIKVTETEDSQGVIGIADLTEYLFGRVDMTELALRENVCLSDPLQEELEKIKKLKKTLFNEVV